MPAKGFGGIVRAMRLLAVLMTLVLACRAAAEPLVVFAASSLKEPLDAIAEDFGDVTVAYGGSGAMARQIGRGAPADVVILAHPLWIDWLQERDAIAEPVAILSNRLVLAGLSEAPVPLTPEGLAKALGDARLAIGQTDSVPAGIYGREALTSLGLWGGVSRRLAEVENVRVATALAARGAVPLALVYASDAAAVPALSVRARLPEDSHSPIRYFAAVTTTATHPAASDFVAALVAGPAQERFAAAGFVPLFP